MPLSAALRFSSSDHLLLNVEGVEAAVREQQGGDGQGVNADSGSDLEDALAAPRLQDAPQAPRRLWATR